MPRILAVTSVAALLLSFRLHSQQPGVPADTVGVDHALDRQSIASIVAQGDDAWNRRDANGIVAHVTEDTDHIGVGGHWTTGKAALLARLSQVLDTLRVSQGGSIERLRFLSPDIAVAQVRRRYWNDKKTWYAISTQVFQKKNGEWLNTAFQNTLIQNASVTAQTPALSPASTRAESEVLAVVQDLQRANLHNDADALSRIYADDYIFTNYRGRTADKRKQLESVRSGVLVFDSVTVSDERVRVYGDAAVITFHRHQVAHVSGEPRPGDVRVTDVLVWGSRGWQLVAAQVTPIQP